MAQANLTHIQAVDLARRIQGLSFADQAKLLARVILAEGQKVPRTAIRTIQRRAAASRMSAAAVDDQVVQTVRAVRSGRARKRR
jgi:hypothetical protein